MRLNRRRTRTISFRLDDDEYENLKRRCSVQGARSISDFARALLSHPNGRREPSRKSLEAEITELSGSMNHLREGIERLIVTFERSLTRGDYAGSRNTN